jgi:hypothetical protein
VFVAGRRTDQGYRTGGLTRYAGQVQHERAPFDFE